MAFTDLIASHGGADTGEMPALTLDSNLFSAAMNVQTTQDNPLSQNVLIKEGMNERDRKFKEISGQDASSFYDFSDAGIADMPIIGDGLMGIRSQKLDKHIEEQRAANPKYKDIPTYGEIVKNARDKALMAQQKKDYIYATENAGSRGLSMLGGGFVGSIQDPITILTSLAPIGKSKTILGGISKAALVNAGAEAAAQPLIADWKKKLGVEYTFADQATQIAFAGLFGGAMEGIGHAAPHVFKASSNALDELSKHPALNAMQSRAAEFAARFARVKERNPVIDPTPAQEAAHFENIHNVEQAMEAGKPAYEVTPIYDETQAVIPGAEKISDKALAERGMAGKATTDVPQKPMDDGLFDVSGRNQEELFGAKKQKDIDFETKQAELKRYGLEYDNQGKLKPAEVINTKVSETVPIETTQLLNANQQLVNDLAQLRNPKLLPKPPKVQSLVSYLIKKGGIRDLDGVLKASDAIKARPGLISNKKGKGLDPDQAMQAAIEGGYFSNRGSNFYAETYAQLPDRQELYDLLTKELAGEKVLKVNDVEELLAHETRMANLDGLDSAIRDAGLDPLKATDAEIAHALEGTQWVTPVKKVADDFYTEPQPIDDVLADLEAHEISSEEMAQMHEFDEYMKGNENVELTLEDGRTLTLRELNDEMENEQNWLSEISSCATGGQ